MSTVQQNLCTVRESLATFAQSCARSPEEVTLLAVSKNQSVAMIEEAIAIGQRAFGENYLQEAIAKIHYFAKNTALEWHFIGQLQSNKSKLIAENFDWCHTVDRFKIAQRLNAQRPLGKPELNILIQINISSEQNKSGIHLDALPELAARICCLPRLRLRGLMVIPAVESDYQRQLILFGKVYQVFLTFKAHYPGVDTLSMGMTDDMAAAIRAGSTLVRIGRAIFGERDNNLTDPFN